MRNWRTTLAAGVTAVAGFVLFSPERFHAYPVVIDIAKYIMVGGLAAMGIAGKDAAVHSTSADVVRADQQAADKIKDKINNL